MKTNRRRVLCEWEKVEASLMASGFCLRRDLLSNRVVHDWVEKTGRKKAKASSGAEAQFGKRRYVGAISPHLLRKGEEPPTVGGRYVNQIQRRRSRGHHAAIRENGVPG